MPTPGYIALQFNATYLGDYRICWRVNTGSYSCFTMNCGSIGACTAYITPVSFPTNVCDTDNYNGYVQAACEDPNTLDGAVMWDIDYATIQACVPWEYSCLGTNVTTSSFNIDITGSGLTLFVTGNIQSNSPECLCESQYLGPPLLRSAGGSNFNTNLVDSPWVSNNLTQVYAWNPVTQAAGNYHWVPDTVFCGRFQGCWSSSTANPILDIQDDPCSDYNTTEVGPECIYKPAIIIAPPPSGGTQATAEFVIGLGGLNPGTVLNITNPGTGGTPGTYYTWNQQYTGGNLFPQVGSCSTPRGMGYFKVIVGTSGSVTSVESCNNINCDPTQPVAYGYAFSNITERVLFVPSSIGGCTGVVCITPSSSNDLGKILDVVFTNPGSGYTSIPVVTVSSPICGSNTLTSVTLPTITVTTSGGLQPCPSFVPNSACGTYPNNAYPTIPSMPIGTEFNICYPNNVTPPAAVGWDIQKDTNGCCYDCVTLSVGTTNANPNPKVVYTDCDGNIIRVETITSSPFVINCVVNDSWASDASDTTFQVIGPC